MIGKKINQLATELAPASTDLTIIGNPTTGVSKKITLAQLGAIFSGAVSFYTNLASFPATGTLDVIFCAKDTQKLYLWSGSAYVEIFPSQALLDTYQLRSEKGVSNGYASLDSSGKVPVSQLPSSIMEYKGTWNAATNTPTLANGTGDTGDVYICNVAGTVNFGAGPITFAVGDYVIYSGSIWQRSSGAVGTVTSVAASITGDAIGITGSPVTTSGTLAFAFAGTGAQYIKGDGTLATFPSTIAQAERLITEVYNSTGATLTKGTIVYINGGQGNLPTVTKALATGDSTSAQTFGVVQADITNNNNGYVVVAGKLSDLDTQAYTEGTQLYLSSTTAGAWTSTKQYAPAHLVYVGIVVRSHPTQGIVEIKIQNGYEMDELHNVAAQTPTNNDGLFWESATSLWKNKSIATILGGTPVTGSGTLYALTKWGFTSGAIINSNLYDTGSVIYNNNATAGAFAVQFNGNATSGMSYGLLINAGSDANDIALRIQNVSSTSEYFFVYGDGKVKMNNIPNATTDTDTFLVSDGGFIKYRTGAQLLSDIGGQAALTNPVTGTGTTNYLPKFTGTSTIGNSNIVNDASGNIGVGTSGVTYASTTLLLRAVSSTSTNYVFIAEDNATNELFAIRNSGATSIKSSNGGAYVLDISNTAANTYGSIVLRGNSRSGEIDFATNSTVNAAIWSTSNSLIFATNGYTEAMRLNASGNLSIGNTNDTYKLDVSGASRILASTYTAGAILYLRDAAATGSNTTFGGLFLGSSPGTDFVLGKQSTNTVGSFAIKTGGGTTLFTLADTGAATFSSSAENVITWSRTSSKNWSLSSDSAGGYFKNTTDSVIPIYMTNAGNVGIGTTSPSALLHLASGTPYIYLDDTSTSGTRNRFQILNGDVGVTQTVTFGFNNTSGTNLQEVIAFNENGRVGIGTTSPQNVLDLGAASNGNGLTWSNYSNLFSEYSSGALWMSSNFYGNIGSSGYKTSLTATFGAAAIKVSGTSGSGNSGLLQFYVDDAVSKTAGASFTPTERMRITSGGNVGIGTTSIPNAISGTETVLKIANSNVASLYLDSTGTGKNYAIFSSASGNLTFYDTTAGSERMRIKSNGIINLSNVPSSSAGLSSGDIYKTVAGVLMIV